MFRKIFIILLVLALAGCTKSGEENVKTGIVGENQPITRAEAARMAALNSYTLEEINSMERKIAFEDTDISKWYDKYINAAFSCGIIAGVDNEHFAPDEYLTLRQAQFLLDKLKADNKVKLQYAPEDKDKPIPYNIWVTAFEKDMNTQKLKACELKVYADKNQWGKLGDNMVITELGVTCYDGYENIRTDDEISAIVNGNVIAALKSINRVTEFENMEVAEKGDNYIKVKVTGGVRKFNVGENNVEVGNVVGIIVEEDSYQIK